MRPRKLLKMNSISKSSRIPEARMAGRKVKSEDRIEQYLGPDKSRVNNPHRDW